MKIPDAKREAFERDGVVVFEGFYDTETEVVPILKGIHDIIGLLLEQHGIEDRRRPFSVETFDDGFMDMISADRALGGVLYDAIKQIPAYCRFAAGEKSERLMQELRHSALIGSVARGNGIRIDIPNEDAHLTGWHQDYHGQLRSVDGCVFWSPLRDVTQAMGPVRFCLGSHKDGMRPLTKPAANTFKKNTTLYGTGLRLADEDEVTDAYDQVEPLTKVGDLVVIDFLCLHRSNPNRSPVPRWAMTNRWFNFLEPEGRRLGWPGSYAHGRSFQEFYPDLFVPTPEADG